MLPIHRSGLAVFSRGQKPCFLTTSMSILGIVDCLDPMDQVSTCDLYRFAFGGVIWRTASGGFIRRDRLMSRQDIRPTLLLVRLPSRHHLLGLG